ncbi:MAG: hypothetical protein H0W47_08220 [Polaromonas sp.]|uniref:hypothetical protein n=1 Tax=Polaromonas sp. TaxID=1869339 RepID=UPI0017B5FCC1|nr:hypothetical protein [Polaromonas sp.]MBA3593774.1 hypothetical protein [Polaromonas sp.]
MHPSLNNQAWARGLLDGKGLADLGRVRWVAEHLGPLSEQLRLWAFMSSLWLVFCGVVGKTWQVLSGNNIATGAAKHTWWSLVLLHVVLTPAVVAFGLNLVYDIASGELANSVRNPDELPQRLAWMYSMLVAVLGAGLFITLATLMTLLRAAGLVAGPEETASDA